MIHGQKKCSLFQECNLEILLLLCNSMALAIYNATLYLVLMEKDMEFAQSKQENYISTSTPQHKNLVFAAGTHTAHVVGGDYYYDFIPFGNDVLELF